MIHPWGVATFKKSKHKALSLIIYPWIWCSYISNSRDWNSYQWMNTKYLLYFSRKDVRRVPIFASLSLSAKRAKFEAEITIVVILLSIHSGSNWNFTVKVHWKIPIQEKLKCLWPTALNPLTIKKRIFGKLKTMFANSANSVTTLSHRK